MQTIDWLQMLSYQESIRRCYRALLRSGSRCTLNASELEILSLLYLYPQENTPLALSRRSGAKKEAISRSIRQLSERGCLEKTANPRDERSYALSLTEIGHEKLRENYDVILQPMYELHRRMGDDFELLFRLLEQAVQSLSVPAGEPLGKEDP